jgi:ABC-type antimicrobial peptide transport system permease subunit
MALSEGSFHFPIVSLPVLAVIGMIVAVGAAVLPARQASRLDVIDALRVD